MKKLILVFATIAISAGVYAQAGSTSNKTSPQDTISTRNQSLLIQQDLNRTQNQNLQNNQQDLNRTQNQNLQNQQNFNSTQNQNSQQDKNWTNGQSSSEVQPTCSGVVMVNGKMMNMNNGTMSPFDENGTTMINGTKIMSDGSYTQKNGSKMKMKEGYHMDMAGNIMVPLKTNYDKSGAQIDNKNSTEKSGSDKNNTVKSDKQTVQKGSGNKSNNDAQKEQINSGDHSNSDGVIMQNGKMMMVKNGQKTTLRDNEMTMSNGTKLMSDGTYIKKDGSKMTMTEGQQMDMEGNIISMKTNKDNNMDYNRHDSNNPVDKSNLDGVMMQNGKMMLMKNGQKTTLRDNEMTMSNGTKIMSDGTCIKKDGTKMTMKEGQHMDMSGNMVTTKTNKDNNMYLVPDSTMNREK